MVDLQTDERPPPNIVVSANDTTLAKCKNVLGVISKALSQPTSLLLRYGSPHGSIWHTKGIILLLLNKAYHWGHTKPLILCSSPLLVLVVESVIL